MSRITTRPSLSLITIDEESISSQIDRLNQVIQNLTNQRLSPSSRLKSSRAPSIDSFLDSGKISIEETESDEEVFSLDERKNMQIEDFLSHEQRNYEKVFNNSKIILELNQEQLVKLCEDLGGIRDNFDLNTDRIVNTGNKQLILVLKDRSCALPHKEYIPLLFNSNKKRPQTPHNDSSLGLDSLMAKSFSDSFPLLTQGLLPGPSFISSCEQSQSKANNDKLQRHISKLQWQISEVAQLKANFSNKLLTLSTWEKTLTQRQNEIFMQEQRILNEKFCLEKDLEVLHQQRQGVLMAFEENKKKQEIIRKTLDGLKTQKNFVGVEKGLEKKQSFEAIIVKPRRAEQKNEIDNEINELEKEINGLESEKNSFQSELVQTKVDRLKTKLSGLKSKRVINASIERSNSVNKLHMFDREKLSKSPILASASSFKNNPLIGSSGFNVAKEMKENAEKDRKKFGTNEEIQQYLKLRENRLNEREEELSKRENMIVNNLGKLPDSLGLVGIVQNEHRNLKILRNDLEKRQKSVEQQVLAFSRKCSEMKVKEKEIAENSEKIEDFLRQKKQVETQMEFLISLLEPSCVHITH